MRGMAGPVATFVTGTAIATNDLNRLPLKKLGAKEQRAQRLGRRYPQYRVVGGILERGYGVVMQRFELHPFDRTEIGDEVIGLPNGRNRDRFTVQFDLERGCQRRFGLGCAVHAAVVHRVRPKSIATLAGPGCFGGMDGTVVRFAGFRTGSPNVATP